MAVITGTIAGETLVGTPQADAITGLAGDDKALMGAGNDVFNWAPGHGNDTIEGATGTDTLHFDASAGMEIFDISGNAGRVRLTRNVGNVTMDLNDVERIELQALGGQDTLTINDLSGTDLKQVAIDLAGTTPGVGDGAVDFLTVNGGKANNTMNVALASGAVSITGLAAQVTIANAEATDSLTLQGLEGNDKISASALGPGAIALTIDGGVGNDAIVGSGGADMLLGSDGNDTVTGGQGADLAFLGIGNDLFVWNPGDGNDTIEGQDGFDTLRFVVSAASDFIDIDANGARARLFRAIASVTMDLNDVEHLDIRPLAGADNITVNDLAGTDVTKVTVDLAAKSGGAAGDKAIDTVHVNGSGADDAIKVASVGAAIVTSGLAAVVSVLHTDKTDVLSISGGIGNDTIDASKVAANKLALQLVGGTGNDLLIGSAGNDTVSGENGDDVVILGAGNDTFFWAPGSGNDTIEGQGGIDTLEFNGSAGAEIFDVSANGGRTRLTRDLGNVVMDLNDVEHIELSTFGGVDKVTVNDPTGTDLKLIAIDLGNGIGGDLVNDSVIVNGGIGNDKINVALAGSLVSFTGLTSQVTIANAEADKDSFAINGLGGNDTIDASKLPAGIVPFSVDGGTGNDKIVGGGAADVLFGGDDNDVVNGGVGADILFGDKGDDTVIGGKEADWGLLGAGNDLFIWNLGDGNDVIEGEADKDTLRIVAAKTDDLFSILADAGRIDLFVSGGTLLDVNDVERIEIQALGGSDRVTVNDLAGTDVAEVVVDLAAIAGGKAADGKADTVIGTFAGIASVTSVGSKMVVGTLTVDHWDKSDVLVLAGGTSSDIFNASAVAAGKMSLRFAGGLGADIMFGGAGNDTFIWNAGDGNDLIEGKAGFDTLQFNGDSSNETVTIEANGGRARLSSDLGPVVMDINDVERIEYRASDGFDTVLVEDLSGTEVKQVAIDLAAYAAIPDGKADVVVALGTAGNDAINVALVGGAISVTGLPARLTITHAESFDSISISASDGNDTINAATLKASAADLSVSGGEGNDKVTGGLGNDVVFGEGGNDKLIGGAGDDWLGAGAGNDLADGGTGKDTLFGYEGKDTLNGGAGDDVIFGNEGDDIITGGTGNDTIRYISVLDGHDVLIGFDGNAAGGQDVLDLESLFVSLGVLAADRAGRISILDKGASVDVFVDTDGNILNGFELTVATLKTSDAITVGQDIIVGA